MVVPKTPTTTAAAAAFGCESRPDHAQRDLSPRHVNGEEHRRVREQRQRQPLQERHIAMVGHEDLQQQRQHHEECGHEVAIEARHQLGNFAHGGDICSDVERIREQQQPDHALQNHGRKRELDVGGQSLAGRAADERAHELNRRHQWVGERHGPEHIETELRARLRIGGDSAWIIVRDAGDQSGADASQRVRFEASPESAEVARSRNAPHWLL